MGTQDRQLLGDFLKTRRAKLLPPELGLPTGMRRRTPGLRREEVAQLAGVSVTWYTWIEQGREITISAEVLASIARTLQLSAQEQAYLFTLAGLSQLRPGEQQEEVVAPILQQFLDHQRHYPAYLIGRYWDLLAWNGAATDLFGDFAAFPLPERNMMWYTFVRPETRNLVINWEARAKRLLAEFRADCSRFINEPALISFLERLKTHSPEFAQWWQQHDVHARDGGRKEFQHPLVGQLALQQQTLRLGNQPDLQIVLHLPLPEWESEAKLQQIYATRSLADSML